MYSTDEIQERDFHSVLSRYQCLYQLLDRQKGRSMLDVIHNTNLSFTNQIVNHEFKINYFKKYITYLSNRPHFLWVYRRDNARMMLGS